MFIERARSAAPGAAEQLAHAIAARYGIPAAEVARRLAIGRFRVKGNVDAATADSFAKDLERLGAVVTVSPADVTPPVASEPVSLVQPRVAVPKPAAPKPEPPKPEPPKPEPPKPEPPRARAPSQSPYTSGLAAAMAQSDLEEPGLGALSGEFPLQLSTLDGADDDAVSSGSRSAAPLPASFGPPPSAASLPASFGPPSHASDSDDIDVSMDDDDEPGSLPASIGPAAGVTALGERARSSAPALSGAPDMFAPPEAQAELQVALEVEDHRRKPAAAPAQARTVAAEPVSQASHGAQATAGEPAAPAKPKPERLEPAWKTHARDERVRYVAGVILATALGFIPATVIASIRERSAFASIDAKYEERESQVISRVQWDDLDRARASFLERKRAERQSIAFTSLLIWAALSGGLAYVWFRVIDWDRVLGPEPRRRES